MQAPLVSSNKIWRNDITGLRALAVIPVLIYHAFPSYIPGGFFGVDIFFVVSGYLISGIIFRGLIKGDFSYINFYEKRVRRILPNLFLCLSFVLFLGWHFLTSDEYTDLAKHTIFSIFFCQNFNLLLEVGYFTEEALRKPLLHLWSLAIEEQFYILFPVICSVLWCSFRSKKIIALMIGILTVASFLFCLVTNDSSFRFYFPICRFWEIGIGIVLAFIETFRVLNFRTLPLNFRHIMSILGLILVVVAMVWGGKENHPGLFTLFPVLGSALLISSYPDALVNRYLLCQKPMTFTGLISYSLYLWHWPLLSFLYLVIPNCSSSLKFSVLFLS